MRRILTAAAALHRAFGPRAARPGRLAADPADQDDLPVPGRRRHRPDRPHRRAPAFQAARPAGRGREPRRRQRRPRRPGGDARRSRRLHHRRDLGFADDGQSVDVREARLQAAAGLHPGGADQSLPVAGGGQPRHRHQDHRRPRQGGQGEARHVELLVRRRRQLQPPRPGRAVAENRHQHRPRALSRRRSGDHGRARRRRAADVQQFRHRASPRGGGQAHRPGGRRQRTPARPIRISRPSPRPFRAST